MCSADRGSRWGAGWAALGWVLALPALGFSEVPPEVAQVLRQRQEALSRITSFQAEAEFLKLDEGKQELEWSIRWWKSGPRERFSKRWMVTEAMGRAQEKLGKQGKIRLPRYPQAKDPQQVPRLPDQDLLKPGTDYRVQEVARRGQEVRQLNIDYGREGTRALHLPLSPVGPYAFDFQRTRGILSRFDPSRPLCVTPALTLDFAIGPHPSLEAVVAAARDVQLTRDPDGMVTIACALALPDAPEMERLRFTFDPARGYLLRRVVAPDAGQREVVAVAEPKPGIFLPTKIVAGSLQQPNLEIRLRWSRVNEPIPDAELEFPFPEGAAVHDVRSTSEVVHLWGPSDRPARTFPSPEAYATWYDAQWREFLQNLAGQPQGKAPVGRNILLIVGNVLLVAVLMGLFILRRQLLRRTSHGVPHDPPAADSMP